MSAQPQRADRSMGCSPVMTLRLLAMAEESQEPDLLDEPEQLLLPLEWPKPKLVVREPERLPSGDRPDPRQWGGRLTLAAFEIMVGRRPAQQLSRIMDARTLHKLSLLTTGIARERARQRPRVTPGRPRLTSVRCFQPHPDAAEVTAVVHDGVRYRAVAMRLAGRGDQWVATAFEMG